MLKKNPVCPKCDNFCPLASFALADIRARNDKYDIYQPEEEIIAEHECDKCGQKFKLRQKTITKYESWVEK